MVSLVVPVFKNNRERSTAKNYCPVSLLFVTSKVFEKLVNNRIVDHIKNSGFFLIFNVFASSLSTANLLKVVSVRIARAYNRSGAIWAVPQYNQALWAWYTSLLYKLRSYEISGQIFGFISSFLSNRSLWVVLDGKSSQEYSINAGVPEAPILGSTLFLPGLEIWQKQLLCYRVISVVNERG